MRPATDRAAEAAGGKGPFLELRVREDRLLDLLAGRQLTAEDLRASTPGARRQLRRLLLQSLWGGGRR
ncbi:hypothetical protein [Microbulbifer yueqingensis]|uniref:Uncharacterized protein n=1 Tax=Microbulbifer yueqingensis TaxID=658219 RepID=A0A1G9BZK9_9GAMM|nr:hypothetical protein [Microbulbifer yueqingensis]SDK44877.1 hypothetical protein SAMN05216212_2422 [Microbulbifer yueqingensis]